MTIRATILIDTNDSTQQWSGKPMAQDVAQAALLIQSRNLEFAQAVKVISIREESTRDGAARGAP